ncbi:uncharacterized protein ACBR49_003151 isoform 2-T2 [Aulostomus maculatus]
MAFRHGRKSVRDVYEDCFPPVDREVTLHRVVNIVGKRNAGPPLDFDRDYNDEWYRGPSNYHDAVDFHRQGSYPDSDYRYYDDNPNFGGFRRNPSPPRQDAQYSQPRYARDDLRHQLRSRHGGRPGPHHHSRGRGFGPSQREEEDYYRQSSAAKVTRERSPGRRKPQPPAVVRAASNTSSKDFSPDRDKGCTSQQTQPRNKPVVVPSLTPSSPAEESPHSSGSSKEKPSSSALETEEVVTSTVKPKLTQDQDVKACRSEAIKAKAVEVEKHYRQTCETFVTVVKMLIAKEPSLDNLLESALDQNLLEMKQRCLDDLRHYVKELDEVLESPDPSA